MITKKIDINNIHGSGDFFDKKDLKTFCSIYFDWKNLNTEVEQLGSRRINIPEILSEGLASYLLNLARTNNVHFEGVKTTSFDCINPLNGITYQIKAVSTKTEMECGGPSSFGPRSEADAIILMHFICNDDKINFYLIKDEISGIMVNRKQNFQDQCEEGRRPRFSLLKKLIEQNRKPDFIYRIGDETFVESC